MKKTLLSLSLLGFCVFANAQVGVGTNDPKATLDVVGKPTDTATPDGVIAPRLKRTELIAKNGIYTTTQTGAIVYVTDITGTADVAGGKSVEVKTIGYYYFDGIKWMMITPDLRMVGTNNHVTQDAGVGGTGTSLGTGSNNIALGKTSLNAITTGTNNIAVGINALNANTTGGNAIAIGANTLTKVTNLSIDDSPIAIGENALNNLTSGIGMMAIGYNALSNATNGGNYSLAIGNNALGQNNNSWNTAIGYNTLNSAKGYGNTAVGYRSAFNLTQGLNNTFLGSNNSVYLNIAVQHDYNTFIGSQITQSSSPSTTGYQVAYQAVSALGAGALNGLPATLTSQTSNTFLGSGATVNNAYAGTSLIFATAVGAQAKVGADNTVILGRLPNTSIDGNGNPVANPQDKVGIGSITPNSTLTVEGSLETGYKEITTNTTLTANDYYVTYNGTADGTVTMPTVGIGTTAFTGRIYKIKNISAATLTVAAAGANTFRNLDTPRANFKLGPGQFVEVVNNGQANDAWDVSTAPPVANWQFSNAYDTQATGNVDISANNSTVINGNLGLSIPITIPAYSQVKIVVNYSVPYGMTVGNATAQGYAGIRFLKNGTEAPLGSRKTTLPVNRSPFPMTTVSASYVETIANSGITASTITYTLNGYIEITTGGATTIRYNMFSTDPANNFNWGIASMNAQVFTKPL